MAVSWIRQQTTAGVLGNAAWEGLKWGTAPVLAGLASVLEAPPYMVLLASLLGALVVAILVNVRQRSSSVPRAAAVHDSYVRGQTLHLAELAGPDGHIRGRIFEDCDLWGPAVLVLRD